MSFRRHVAVRWTVRATAGLGAVVLLYAGLVLFPTPLFANRARYGAYRVYSDGPIPSGFDEVMADVAHRVDGMDPAIDPAGTRIYLCDSRRLYGLFAFLTRKSPETLAIGLNAANEMFVSMSRVRDFASRGGGVFRHTRFEGNPAEVIAHEIAHFASVRTLGYRAHLAQPVWKSEGWAEYQANLAAIRADPDYDLGERIGVLLDEAHWSTGDRLARDLWEWQLLVEFLGEIEGYGLDDLLADEVSLASVRRQMHEWYRTTAATTAPAGDT